jgi:hypothetical protein
MAEASERGGSNPSTSAHPRLSAGFPTSGQSPSRPGEAEKGVVGQVKEAVQGAASNVAERVGDAWESTSRTVREGEQWVEHTAEDLWATMTGCIRRNPVSAVAVAFGCGCLLTACLSAWTASSSDDMARRMSRYSA